MNKDTTTTTPSSSAVISDFGEALTLMATVTANAPGSGTPTQSVDFYDNTTATDLGTVLLAGGAATLTTATLPVGPQTITETYSGDGNFIGSVGTQSETIVVSIYVLNTSNPSPTLTGTLYLSGSSVINIPGRLIVDSPAKPAVTVSGTSQIVASSIGVVGTVSKASTATISPNLSTGIGVAVTDPLVGLAFPMLTGTAASVNLTSGSLTISPGIYSRITVSGTGTKLTLKPGNYVISGGGLSVTGAASIAGNGVMIYNAGSAYPAAGGTYAGITLNTTGSVNLSAPTTGTYAGVLFFQARTNPSLVSITGTSSPALSGTIYASDALLSISGSVESTDALVVNRLQMSGTATASAPRPGPAGRVRPREGCDLDRARRRDRDGAAGVLAVHAVAIPGCHRRHRRRNAVTIATATPSRARTVSLTGDGDEEESSSLFDAELLEDVSVSVLEGGNGRSRPKN